MYIKQSIGNQWALGHIYIYIYYTSITYTATGIILHTSLFLLCPFYNSTGSLVVKARVALEVRIVNSLVITAVEEAKMAEVPHKTGRAAAKNGPIRLNVVIIQESLSGRKSISTNLAKRASLDSLLD